jgi:hypothetical protein
LARCIKVAATVTSGQAAQEANPKTALWVEVAPEGIHDFGFLTVTVEPRS